LDALTLTLQPSGIPLQVLAEPLALTWQLMAAGQYAELAALAVVLIKAKNGIKQGIMNERIVYLQIRFRASYQFQALKVLDF
jgi:hypothetical protein